MSAADRESLFAAATSTHGVCDRDEMWACHTCQMIGSEAQGRAYHADRGHEIRALSWERVPQIWEEWEREPCESCGGRATEQAFPDGVQCTHSGSPEQEPSS